MKKVSGFLANDGTFFEHAAECRLHNAHNALFKAFDRSLYSNTTVRAGDFIKIVQLLQHEVYEYVTAWDVQQTVLEEASILTTEPPIIVDDDKPSDTTLVTSEANERNP